VFRSAVVLTTPESALLASLWSALDPRFVVAATAFAPITGVQGPTRHA
jgi:IMP cyclohydrolase